MIYIIADDLTGASDTGIQFVKNNYKTSLFIINKHNMDSIRQEKNADVLVIDTETREMDEKSARNIIRDICNRLTIQEEDLIFKKIDSTFRGNIAAEIEEILELTQKNWCILSPSFPAQNRITVGAYLLVQNKLLGYSEYSQNTSQPEKNSYLPYLLKKQSRLPIEHIGLTDISEERNLLAQKITSNDKKQSQIMIIDSVDDFHLQKIITYGLSFKKKIVFAGSAGLANCLARYQKQSKNTVKDLVKSSNKPILIVAGSRRSILSDQIKFLKNKIPFAELIIDLEKIFSSQENTLHEYKNFSLNCLLNKQDLIIYTDATYNKNQSIDTKIMQKYNIKPRELEIGIKNFFGILSKSIIDNASISNLVLTGGDIALSVCRELNISNLELMREVLPGIPVSVARYQGNSLNIITKAGGFGEEDTLYNIIKQFKNINNTEGKNNHE